MKQKLSTQLSLGFALIVLITIAVISLAATLLINRQFEKYIENQQRDFSDELARGLTDQYDSITGTWNLDYIHGFGMYALNDGYIIKLYDKNNQTVWDAQNHDMTLCHQIMNDISLRMEEQMPELDGDFVSIHYELKRSDSLIGYADISYYSPYYFDENDFHFVQSLNKILLVIGISATFGAVIAGILLARRIADPITRATDIVHDISEGNYEIQFESKVKTKELHELIQSVNHMASSLKEQEILRKRLTSDVAHELRTPITNVSSYLEAIMEGIWEPTSERLQSCYYELERISDIVSDLEKLRQIESENLKLNKKPVDLLQLTKEVCASFEAKFDQKHLTCLVEGKSSIMSGDRKRLYQVFYNLISNAAKYSSEGGKILIQIEDSPTNSIWTIEDHGIGIAQNDLQLIFERFYRTDRSRNRKTGGAGIGLTIAKAIVLSHGGTIDVESQEGCGSKFTVVFPKYL